MRKPSTPKMIRETQQSQPGGMMQVRKTLVRVRVLDPGESVPKGAVIVENDTPQHDWREQE